MPIFGSFTVHVLLGLGWDEVQNGWDGSQQPSQTLTNQPSGFFLYHQYFRTKMEILLFSNDVHGGNIPNVVGNFLKQNL